MADDFSPLFDTLPLGIPVSGCALTPDICVLEGEEPFHLGQNYPNPYVDETTVPFTLPHAADVVLTLFDPLGRKVAGIVRKGRSAGPQSIKLTLHGLGLAAGPYTYQLKITNRYGTFCQSRQMTAA